MCEGENRLAKINLAKETANQPLHFPIGMRRQCMRRPWWSSLDLQWLGGTVWRLWLLLFDISRWICAKVMPPRGFFQLRTELGRDTKEKLVPGRQPPLNWLWLQDSQGLCWTCLRLYGNPACVMQTSPLHLGSQTGLVICSLVQPSQVACDLLHGHTGISSNNFFACLIMSRDPLLVAPRLKHHVSTNNLTDYFSSDNNVCAKWGNDHKAFFKKMTCRGHQFYQNTKRFLNILGILYMGSCLSLTTVYSVTCSASNILVQLRDLKLQKFAKHSQGDAMMWWWAEASI